MPHSSLVATLLDARMLFALSLYGVLIVLVEIGTGRLDRHVQQSPVTEWIVEHIGLPWARAVALLVFIAVAYPALFGLAGAPPLGTVLGAGDGRANVLLNIAFIVSLLLPLLPLLGQLRGVVLPLQAIAMSTLLFHWLTMELHTAEPHYWPGWETVATLLLLAPLTQWLAYQTNRLAGAWFELREGYGNLLYDGLLLLFQVPVILVYTLGLGEQLH